ncbi:MAG: hypothetical protein AAGF92_19045 [Myxococcota bacterium]
MVKNAVSRSISIVFVVGALVAISGISQCSSTCIETDAEGNTTTFACKICNQLDTNPCTANSWRVLPEIECVVEDQPFIADGTTCMDGASTGVCQAGVCVVSSVCGDGIVEGGEGCDEGANNVTGEGNCLPDCSGFQVCGDGAGNGDEVCDDGVNDGGPMECLSCTSFQICGDGSVTGTEACETNETVNCQTLGGGFIGGTADCNGTCEAFDTSACTTELNCGNGNVDPGEACDDGINDGGEGECLACQSVQTCGDGAAEGTEVCDSGASNGSGEGACLGDCSGVQSCGDGVPNGTEACDDGNDNGGGDGFCLSDCSGTQTCGDGTQNGTEVCDDGINDGGADECLPGCGSIQTCGDGTQNGTEFCEQGDAVACTSLGGGFLGGTASCDATCAAWDISTCTTSSDCGNGQIDPGEACDDGTNDGGEGECLACGGIQVCGDGNAEGTEACDEGASNGSGPGVCVDDCSGVQLCGDGVQNGTEACDDGANVGGDNGCLPGCVGLQVCGDGSVNGTETCDDGVNDGGEGECWACVSLQTCGDNVAEGTESCDDGVQNGTGNNLCLSDCSDTQVCGDGTQNGTEFCEQGDSITCTSLGAGFLGGTASCDSACAAWDVSTCTTSGDCGNGTTDPGEVCDDGVNDGGEGECLACQGTQSCGDGTPEGTESCDDGPANGSGDNFCLGDCSGVQSCGDAQANGTEVCDDGTNDGGDEQCLPGCQAIQSCGDGTANGTEVCDDGVNDGGNNGCLPSCQAVQVCGDGTQNGTEFCEQGDTVTCTDLGGGFLGGTASCDAACAAWDTAPCTTAADCGDGVVDPGELCDDGVNDGGNGQCLACQGFQACGDSVTEGTEACDDGASNGGGEGFCTNDCSAAQACGDSVTNGTELCDDGINDGGENGCLPGCQSIQVCGDNVANGTELCDDGVNDGGNNECLDCTSIQVCGDSVQSGTEVCDDGDNDGGSGECLSCLGIQTCGDATQEGTEICEVGDQTACTGLDPAFTGGTATCNAVSCESWDTSQCVNPGNCGNGQLDPGETCDDGANNGGGNNFCLADCSATQVCGDDLQNGTEACDDGSDNGTGDGFCLGDCSGTQSCGDGTVDGTELCELGDTVDCTTLPGGFDGGTASCDACLSYDDSTCTSAPSTCTVEYDLIANFQITDTTGGLGDATFSGLDGRITIEFTADGSGNIIDGDANLLHYWVHNDFTTSSLFVTVITNVHGFAPNCNGDVNPTWRQPGDAGFPDASGCGYSVGSAPPVATGSLSGGTVTWDGCSEPNYWSSTPNDYDPTDVATGPGCMNGFRSVGNVNCSGFFCSAGNLASGDNPQNFSWNQPLVNGPTSGPPGALSLSADPSRSTVSSPLGNATGFQSYNVPNDPQSNSRTWVSWTGTRNGSSPNTTCN